MPTFSHSTVARFRQRLRREYLSASGLHAVRVGAALAGLTDAQLANLFNLANPSAELTALRTRVDRQAQRKAGVLSEAGA